MAGRKTAAARKLPTPQRTDHPHIDRVAGVCGGEPKIKGTGIAVWVIAGWHGMGMSVDEIVAIYPHLTAAQVHDALSYYYDHKAEIDEVRAQNTEEYWQAKLGDGWKP